MKWLIINFLCYFGLALSQVAYWDTSFGLTYQRFASWGGFDFCRPNIILDGDDWVLTCCSAYHPGIAIRIANASTTLTKTDHDIQVFRVHDNLVAFGCAAVDGLNGYVYMLSTDSRILKATKNDWKGTVLPNAQYSTAAAHLDPQNFKKIFYATHFTREINIFDITTETNAFFWKIPDPNELLLCFSWFPDGSKIFVSTTASIFIVDRNGQITGQITIAYARDVIYHPRTNSLLIANGYLMSYSLDTQTLTEVGEIDGGVSGLSVGPDGCVYIYSFTGPFRICDGDPSGGFILPPGMTPVGPPKPPCNASGTYRTQSEGDWGDKCSEGFKVGCYRDSNFATCFPDGLDVGCPGCPEKKNGICGYHMHFDSSADVENYLPQLGAPGVLNMDYQNPSNPPPISTTSGNFGGQVTALALSIGFDNCDASFGTACGALENLYVCDQRCSKCKKDPRNVGNCKRNVGCQFLREEDEEDETGMLESLRNNKNNGKPKYANCEPFYGKQVKEIFEMANSLLGGCAEECLPPPSKRNNKNCVACKRGEEERNNKQCSRNNNCKKNNNCCCCAGGVDPQCSPPILNACVTLINQAFIFGKTLADVEGGSLFQKTPCV